MSSLKATPGDSRVPSGAAAHTLAALGVSQFRYLWAGSAAGQLAWWVQIVAQGWLAYELTGSAAFLGLVSAAAALPGFLLMLPGGALADRRDRRAILLYTNVVMTVASLALALAVAAGVVEPWHLVILAGVIGAASALNLPARQSLGPELVGHALVSNAIALFAISFNGSRILGPALAGIIIPFLGLTGCFVLQTAIMALSTLLTFPLRPDESRGHASTGTAVANVIEGIRFLMGQPILRGCTILAALQNLFGMAYSQLLPIFAGDELEIGAAGLGALFSAVGAGAMLGAFAAAALSTQQQKGVLMFTTSFAWAAALVLFPATRTVPLALATLLGIGVTAAVSQIACQTILNLALPNAFRGRVMSIFMMTWSIPPLAALPLGWVADRIGAPATVQVTGVLLLATMALSAVWLKGLWGFRDADYERGAAVVRPAVGVKPA